MRGFFYYFGIIRFVYEHTGHSATKETHAY